MGVGVRPGLRISSGRKSGIDSERNLESRQVPSRKRWNNRFKKRT